MLRRQEEGYWDWGVGVGRREGGLGKGAYQIYSVRLQNYHYWGGGGGRVGYWDWGVVRRGGDLGKGAYQIYSVR